MNSPARDLAKLLQANARGSSVWDVFRDFIEMAALAISNTVDLPQRQAREERYLAITKRYDIADLERFSRMFACLVEALEEDRTDVMGAIFGELDLGNSARGQFFSPYHLCKAIASLTLDPEQVRELIAQRGFITVNEPAVGGGAMVIAWAEAMRESGINYQQHLHVVAQDVDPRAVHMAYVQFSLLHIPAVVILGNTLALEEREHWRTPAHVLGFWDWKLRRGAAADANRPLVPQPIELTAHAPSMPMQPDLFGVLGQAA